MSEAAGDRPGLSWPVLVIAAALALFGALTLIQWTLAAFVGLIKGSLLIVVVIAAIALVLQVKARR